MSFDGDNKQWICGKARSVNLLKVGSIIGDPCLQQSPIQVVTAVRLYSPSYLLYMFVYKALEQVMTKSKESNTRLWKPDRWNFLEQAYYFIIIQDKHKRSGSDE